MKLRESLAVGSVVAGASLGMVSEGCTFSQYPQGKPGAVQSNKQTVAETEAMESELVDFSEVGESGNVVSELEDPFQSICDDMRGSVSFMLDGKDVSIWCSGE